MDEGEAWEETGLTLGWEMGGGRWSAGSVGRRQEDLVDDMDDAIRGHDSGSRPWRCRSGTPCRP